MCVYLCMQTTAEAQLKVPVQGSDTCEGPAAIVLCQLLGMVSHVDQAALDALPAIQMTGLSASDNYADDQL